MKNFTTMKCVVAAALLCSGINANAQVFQKAAETNFLGLHRGTPAIADINNDGLMDVYYAGEQYSGLNETWQVDSWQPTGMIFINKGNGNFTGYVSNQNIGLNEDGTFKGFGLPPTIWNLTRWFDFNNDGNLDFISMGKSGDGWNVNTETSEGEYTLLYKNGGAANNYLFSEVVGTNIPQGNNEYNSWGGNISKSSMSFGDYNHDGFVDIVMQMYHKYKDGDENKGERAVVLLKNNGDGTFSDQKVFNPIPYEQNKRPADLFDISIDEDDNTTTTPTKKIKSMTHGAVVFGDLNNDGWLDIVTTGWTNDSEGADGCFYIYKNNGDGTFSELDLTGKPFENVQESDIAMADINNDGWLDIISIGSPQGGGDKVGSIYLNNGDGEFNFTASTVAGGNGLYGSAESQLRVCDLNHDGLVDVITTGWSNVDTGWNIRVFLQNSTNSFDKSNETDLPGLFNNGGYEIGHIFSSTAVDMFGVGEYAGCAANVFKNLNDDDVTAPSEPTNVNATADGNKVTVKWNGEANGLGTSYNVYCKNIETGSISMILPADIETGSLKTIQDLQTAVRSDNSAEMKYEVNLPAGTYEVGVQAVNPDAVTSKFTKAVTNVTVVTGISTIKEEAAPAKAFINGNNIYVESAKTQKVTVYNISGTKLSEGVTNKNIKVYVDGIILVKTGNQVEKIVK